MQAINLQPLGAHLNPAISIAATIVGDLRGSRLFAYILAQLAGAFVGTAAAWLGHYGLSGRRLVYGRPSGLIADDIAMLDQGARGVVGLNATAPLFATFPARHVSMLGAFIDQVSGGTLFNTTRIFSLSDRRHRDSRALHQPHRRQTQSNSRLHGAAARRPRALHDHDDVRRKCGLCTQSGKVSGGQQEDTNVRRLRTSTDFVL